MSDLKAVLLPAWRLFPPSLRTWSRKAIVKAGALLVMAVLTLLDPIIRIRLAMMVYSRIGHLTMNTDIFVRRLQLDGRPPRTRYVFIAADTPDVSNREVVAQWKRRLTVLDRGPLSAFLRFVWPQLWGSRFVVPLRCTSEEYEEFVRADTIVKLSADDERRGREGLRRMGIEDGAWFACFYSRDSHYLRTVYDESDRRAGDMHNVRDSNVQNFMDAARLIALQDGYAIRMGAVVQQPVAEEPRIIDYASKYRDEFMDVYLSARCKFFLGDSAGLAQVPLMFDRPIAYTNSVPLWNLNPGRDSLMIPKLFRRAGDARLMTFGEMAKHGAYDANAREGGQTSWYRERGIDSIENSADDILDLCQDMLDLLNREPPPAAASELQRLYKDRFFSRDPKRVYAPNIGARFALKYQDLISG